MPLTTNEFTEMINLYHRQLRYTINGYEDGLDDSPECLQEEDEIEGFMDSYLDYITNTYSVGNITQADRFEAMNRFLTLYQQIEDLLVEQEWIGGFDHNAMRDAFLTGLGANFIITQAEIQLDLINERLNEYQNSIIEEDNMNRIEPLFSRVIALRVIFRVLRNQIGVNNTVDTIQQVIVHMHTLDLYLDEKINELDMTFDISRPLFFTLYPPRVVIPEDDPADDYQINDDIKVDGDNTHFKK